MRLRTIGLIGILVLGLLAGPLPTEAQKATEITRVGYLGWGSGRTGLKSLRKGLRELGYVDGQNIFIITRSARAKGEAELVRLKVDVIVTTGASPAIRATPTTDQTAGGSAAPVLGGSVKSMRADAGISGQ